MMGHQSRQMAMIFVDKMCIRDRPRPIPTLDSVVYNGSTFGQEKQENDKSARIQALLDFFSSCKRNG